MSEFRTYHAMHDLHLADMLRTGIFGGPEVQLARTPPIGPFRCSESVDDVQYD